MAFHNRVRLAAAGISLLLIAAAPVEDKKAVPSAKEIADGWVMLFDGETTFGWGDGAKVVNGELVVGGEKATTLLTAAAFPPGDVDLKFDGGGKGGQRFGNDGGFEGILVAGQNGGANVTIIDEGVKRLAIRVPAGESVRFSRIWFRPANFEPLFDGKTLAGWKPFAGNPKQEKSVFAVTPAGELSLKNGPGDLQTEKQFDDFALQLDCKTNGEALNSGVFFRCLPGQYQQGYEAQIQNSFLNNDRTKPVDYGTGAIYRRVKARKVVSNDNEWFTMTVLARGPQISTWVNGYPVVSWTDDRKPAENARQGLYMKKGPISLQGHDPTTDLLFRNIRIAELK